jgi:hypothetical protein
MCRLSDNVLGPDDEVSAAAENDNYDILLKSENPPSDDSSLTDDSSTSKNFEDSSAQRLAGGIACVFGVMAAFTALLLLSLVGFGMLVFFLLSIPCFLCLALLCGGCPDGAIQVSTFSISKDDDDTHGFVHVHRTWQNTTRRASISKKGRAAMTKGHPLLSSSEIYPTTVTIEEIQGDDKQDPEAGLTPIV